MEKIIKVFKELFFGVAFGVFVGMILGIFVQVLKVIDIFEVSIFWILFFLILSFLMGVFIHEMGHLVMGMLTACTFSSFRFINLHIQKNENGKLKVYFNFIPGTLGQCLMKPPRKDPTPYFWYHFGGVFFNLIMAIISIIFLFFVNHAVGLVFLLSNVFMNLFIAITNWFPFKGALNDGHNVRIMKENSLTQTAMFYLLDLNARLTEGQRLDTYNFSEVEKLDLPADDSIQRNVLMYLVNYYQILFATEKYEALLERLVDKVEGESHILSWMIQTEYYFMKLLLGYEDAHQYKTPDVQKFMRMLKNNEGILLMQVYEDFYEHEKLDTNLYDMFVKQAKKSVTPGVADALIDYAEKLFFIK